jgi:outer membrane immunogenic protein
MRRSGLEAKMKKFVIGLVGMVAMATSASAADLAARPYTTAPPPMVAAIYDWSGFYIGINGGGGSARKCWDLVSGDGVIVSPPSDEGCHDATGGTVGGQIGYRWQVTNWVFGIEGQGNWADFTGSNPSLTFHDETNRSKIDAFGLITGQVGYAWNNVLFYVKGGAAVVGDKYDNFEIGTGLPVTHASETRWGGAVGAGLEFGFAPGWSLGVEYDHLFLGSRDVTFTGQFLDTIHIKQDVDMGLVRLNYRFGGPVLARY